MADAGFASDLIAEATEHLDAIEPLLISAEHQGLNKVAIDTLFRSFHSLKGLARVADIQSLETVTHQAEAYLYPVRAGAGAVSAAGIEALLRLVDAVRLSMAGGNLARFTAPDGLAQDLQALTDAAPSPGGTASSLDVSHSPDALGLEPDMARAFGELLCEVLPELAQGVAATNRHAIGDAVDLLIHAARRIGLAGFAQSAMRLGAAPQERQAQDLSALLRLARHVELLTGVETGWGAALAIVPEAGVQEQATAVEPAPVSPDPLAPLAARFAHWGISPQHLPLQASPAMAAIAEDAGTRLAELVLPLPSEQALAELTDGLPIVAGRGAVIGQEIKLALLLAVSANGPDPDHLTAMAESHGGSLAWLDGVNKPVHFGEPQVTLARPVGGEDAQVRVPVDVLDKLFGRIGSFFALSGKLNVLATESAVTDALRRLSDHAVTRAPELLADVEILQRDRRAFLDLEAEIGHFISLIHESTLGLRVIPFENVIARFPRMVRDSARELGKTVQFEQKADGIKIDKGMADMLLDPLMHMIRNAIDHGVEPPPERAAAGKPAAARLSLTAEQQGNRLILVVSDDGRGIDIARVGEKAVAQRLTTPDELASMSEAQIARFIFTPGFSTRSEASTVSGRGVGMDVVLVNVTRLGGRIDIENRAGAGTTFRLDMPLSAAIRPMLLVDTGVQPIGFPEAMVAEAAIYPASSVQSVNGQPSLLMHGRFVPLFDLCDLMRLPNPAPSPSGDLAVVICSWKGRRVGFRANRILRRAELLIRETHLRVAELPGVGGISMLGADRIVLVLDPDKLFHLAAHAATRGLRSAAALAPAETGS